MMSNHSGIQTLMHVKTRSAQRKIRGIPKSFLFILVIVFRFRYLLLKVSQLLFVS